MFRLAHLALAVKDCERSADFYVQVLGCTVMNRLSSDLLNIIYLQCGDLIIELLQYIDKSPAPRGSGVYDHLAFTVSDIRSAMSSLISKGVEFEADVVRLSPDGSKIIFLAGPDGERIELVEQK